MSLATRCSACGTMFRVVQDQLRVSEGWVRCGRCDTVFNALDALVDLEAEVAAAAPSADGAPSDEAFYGRAGPREDEVEDGPHRPTIAAEDEPSRERALERAQEPVLRERPPADPRTEPGWADPGSMAQWAAASERPGPPLNDEPPVAATTTAPIWRPAAEEPQPEQAEAPLPAAAAATPAFIRHAEREARWTSPAMRAALIGMTLILSGVLGMQAVYHFRDQVAAQSALADGLLRSACSRWGCKIEPPRRIDQVTLEGSGLSRVPQQAQAVKLAINLRNRGSSDLMMPSFDLSLTDAKGELIARRVLAPADFRIDPPRIRRGAELPLELVLSTGDRAIAGYTVELFYP